MTHTFVGNLTDAPEKRAAGTSTVVEFRMAISDGYRNAAGEWVNRDTIYWPVQVWGAPAEAVAAQVRRGAKVMVVGDFRRAEWTDKTDGQKKSRNYIQAQYVGLALGDQPRSHTDQQGASNADTAPPAPTEVASPQWDNA